MSLSHIWFSDHSFAYIELGTLSSGRIPRNGSAGNPVGEVTVFLGYDWSAKRGALEIFRKEFHAHTNYRNALAARIVGATIESACLAAHGLQIEIGTSTGDTLTSASSKGEEPDWDVGFNSYQDGWLHIENRRLQFSTGIR